MYIFLIYFFLSFILKESQVFSTGICPNNLIFTTCGTNCPKTCENNGRPEPCFRSCVVNVCECPRHLVLFGNKCVPLSECPKNSRK